MKISVTSSNSPKPQIITETSKDLPRIVHTSCKFRVSLCQKIKHPKTPKKTRKKMKEEKGKRGFTRPRLVFPVKKMTSVVSSVFSRKKTLKGENRGQRDDSAKESTEADKTMDVVKLKPKHNSLQKKSLWGSARTRLKILILGQRLKTRRRRIRQRRSVSFSEGNGEQELCKKRILMGERCKPINESGVLKYDGDGILVPEP